MSNLERPSDLHPFSTLFPQSPQTDNPERPSVFHAFPTPWNQPSGFSNHLREYSNPRFPRGIEHRVRAEWVPPPRDHGTDPEWYVEHSIRSGSGSIEASLRPSPLRPMSPNWEPSLENFAARHAGPLPGCHQRIFGPSNSRFNALRPFGELGQPNIPPVGRVEDQGAERPPSVQMRTGFESHHRSGYDAPSLRSRIRPSHFVTPDLVPSSAVSPIRVEREAAQNRLHPNHLRNDLSRLPPRLPRLPSRPREYTITPPYEHHDIITAWSSAVQVPRNNRGSDSTITEIEDFVAKLPTIAVKTLAPDGKTCVICEEVFDKKSERNEVENAVQLPCEHVFGSRCIGIWMSSNNAAAKTCPICRRQLLGNS